MGWLVCTTTGEDYEKLGVASTFVLQKDSRCFLTTSGSGEGTAGAREPGRAGRGRTVKIRSVRRLLDLAARFSCQVSFFFVVGLTRWLAVV